MKKSTHHSEITNKIIKAIEDGKDSFTMPWINNTSMPVRASTGERYRGINILNLWMDAELFGYQSNEWAGYATWKKKGGQVRKGSKGSIVVHFSMKEKEDKKTGEKSMIPLSRTFKVFNRDCVDGLPEIEHEFPTNTSVTDCGDEVLALAERVGCNVKIEGSRAFYRPSTDDVTMPLRELFIERENISADVAFASTLCHELVHFTGHSSRLDRDLDKRDKPSYAFEELVAELGSSFLCADLGFNYSGVEDHAGYIASWLKVLKSDNTAIFRASALASKAAEYIFEGNEEQKSIQQTEEKAEVA